jgi:hypothetical protein
MGDYGVLTYDILSGQHNRVESSDKAVGFDRSPLCYQPLTATTAISPHYSRRRVHPTGRSALGPIGCPRAYIKDKTPIASAAL